MEGTGENKLVSYAKKHLEAISAKGVEERKKQAEVGDAKDMFNNIDFSSCDVVLFERLGT